MLAAAHTPNPARCLPREPLPAAGKASRLGALLAELPGAVRRGGTPDPVRRLPAPESLAALLEGGLPRGKVSELIGAESSGRTSMLMGFLAAATAAHEVVAVVDLPDAFDPASAARAEVDLGAVLWVRPPSLREGLRCTEMILDAGGFGLVALDLIDVSRRRLQTSVWPRLAHAAARSRAAVIVMAPYRIAGSFAALSLAMHRCRTVWERDGPLLLGGLDVQAVLARNKLGAPGAGQVVTLLSC